MTPTVSPSSTIDTELTAIARAADPAARVTLDDGQWWLEDSSGRLSLGRDRMEAARDLAQYVSLRREAPSSGVGGNGPLSD